MVEALKMYFPKPIWDIAIVMISLYPDNLLTVRNLLNKVDDPLVRWLQFRVRIVNYVTIQNKFVILWDVPEKAFKFLT